jgi:hypothetical protein
MKPTIEMVSAITLKVAYEGGLYGGIPAVLSSCARELVYGGLQAGFSSLCIPDTEFPIINLQEGLPVAEWGRIQTIR